ncbi:MAG: c-type cytochrome [Archangium sp.]|nr:c-type cytochrome [Archangium sp.]
MRVLLSSCVVAFLASSCGTYCANRLEECLSNDPSNRPFGTAALCHDAPNDSEPIVPASFTPPPPIMGGSLTVLPDGTFLAADADRSLVWHADRSGVLGTWGLSSDDVPGRVLAARGKAYVVLRRAGQLAELDLSNHTLTRLPTCVEPRGLIEFGDELLVGCASGEIRAFAADGTSRVFTQDALISDLRDLSVVDGKLIASTFRNAQFFEVTTGQARLLNQSTGSTRDVSGRLFSPRVAWRMRNDLIIAQDEQRSSLGALTTCPPYYGAPPGLLFGVVIPTVYRVDGSVKPVMQLPKAALPVDVAEVSGKIWVAAAGTNSLFTLDADAKEVRLDLEAQPTALATTPDGELVVFTREPARIDVLTPAGERITRVALPGNAVVSTGHELFHRATGQGVACASCHPEAGDDGNVWQFAEGARRTPTLRGGIANTAPFHWTGDQLDLSDLMKNIMVTRMGGGEQSPARTAALLEWLDVQPAMRPPEVNAESARRGQVLFESTAVGCASCHSGTQGTNNLNADVGTGGSFQVPRLTEATWRGTLFHDGRAESLAARFRSTVASDLHGSTSRLTESERADLLEYLKTR